MPGKMKSWGRFVVIVWLSLSLGLGRDLAAQIAPDQLVQQAQEQYQWGQSLQALKLLEQAEQIYEQEGQILPQAQVKALISLAYQQQGNWSLARTNLARSFKLIDQFPAGLSKIQVQGQIWNAQGHYSLGTGQYSQALADWQQAEKFYRQLQDVRGIAGSILDQAEALGKMGFHRRSCDRLFGLLSDRSLQVDNSHARCQALTPAKISSIIAQVQTKSEPWLVDTLNSMGNSLLSMGKLDFAEKLISASQQQSKSLKNLPPATEGKITLSLGNLHQAIALKAKEQQDLTSFQTHYRLALQYFQQLNPSSQTPISQTYQRAAKLNELDLLIANQQWSSAQVLANQIQPFPNYQQNLYAQVKFANSLVILQRQDLNLKYSRQDIADLYLQVIKQAQLSGDSRIESYAWGNLGDMAYEQLNLSFNPQQLFEQALLLAQETHSPELTYRWQWRLGRIYRQQGLKTKAIASYQAALANLNSLRSDLVALEQEIQYAFKEQIEPVYRELAALLLTGSPTEEDLEAARNVIEALQVAQLDNYFQDACLTFEPKSIEQIDQKAAIIYTIILPEQLEVIMANSDRSGTGQIFHHHAYQISQEKLEQTIQQLRGYLTEPDRTREVQELAAQIYTWLIQPLQDDLAVEQPQTLVFVLDGMLQTIPMSVLYDGKQYLIEKYAIALTPGLRLLNSQLTSQADRRPLSFLAGGISQSLQIENQSFAPLTHVPTELASVSQIEHPVLLNQQFTPSNLLEQLNSSAASVLHLATHGQFNANPQQTFLLMWQKKLTIDEFSNIIQNRFKSYRNPLKLLVLSACNTALGDRRAALGLAGIAVRSGARSTLASLWQINDDSTMELMKHFYQHLQQNSKAEALRLAQLELWQRTDKDWQVPAFWSAYEIIGNWQ